jgi:hypothetical protein
MMSRFKTLRDFAALSAPMNRSRLWRCLRVLLCLAFIKAPLFAQPWSAADEAQLSLTEYAKLLAALQEAKFTYTAHATRSTPTEGVCAKWTFHGSLAVSAARKLFHFTQSETTTWSNLPNSSPPDQNSSEVLVTPDAVMTVSSSKDNQVPPETVFGVIKQRAAAKSWSDELQKHWLGLFLGYEQDSLLAISRKAALTPIQDRDINSKSLVGFTAKTDDLEIRALFDPSNDRLLRQIDVSRPATKPFRLSKATLKVLEIRHKKWLPSFVRLKITREYSGGVLKRSELPENAVLTKRQQVSDHVKFESNRYDTDVEINNFVYQPDPHANWFTLEAPIPEGTYVEVLGEHEVPHYWQGGKVKSGVPPTPEKEIRQEIEAAFNQAQSPVQRYESALGELKLAHQHCLLIFADPQHPATRSLYATYFSNYENLLAVSDFRRVAVSSVKIKRTLAQALAKRIGVTLAEDGAPLLVIADENGKIRGQLRGRDLLGADAISIDSAKVQAFLGQHAPTKIDARTLLTDALEQARRDNKRILLQQTATWCGPCRSLSEFLNKQRSVWGKDYIWIKIDERWSHADEVMKPIRKDNTGGIPWMAILDANGKAVATSDNAEGENIGFPSHEEPQAIEHFLKMLKSTAQRMSDNDLQTLRKVLMQK